MQLIDLPGEIQLSILDFLIADDVFHDLINVGLSCKVLWLTVFTYYNDNVMAWHRYNSKLDDTAKIPKRNFSSLALLNNGDLQFVYTLFNNGMLDEFLPNIIRVLIGNDEAQNLVEDDSHGWFANIDLPALKYIHLECVRGLSEGVIMKLKTHIKVSKHLRLDCLGVIDKMPLDSLKSLNITSLDLTISDRSFLSYLTTANCSNFLPALKVLRVHGKNPQNQKLEIGCDEISPLSSLVSLEVLELYNFHVNSTSHRCILSHYSQY